MTEEIIINGVDVAECKHYKLETCLADYLFTDMAFSEAKCVLSPNCYFKQLKRLEQESKQLTQWLDEARRNADFWCDKCTSLEQENKELKKAYDEISNNSEILHENHSLRIANAKLREDLWQHGISMREWREQSLKYRSALEEIRKHVSLWKVGKTELDLDTILDKINEVLNDK